MATLWDIITENSTLPVGATFWEHLNSPKIGTGTVIIGGERVANRTMMQRSVNRDNVVKNADRVKKSRYADRNNERTVDYDITKEADRCL